MKKKAVKPVRESLLLVLLQVVQQNLHGLALLAKVLHDGAAAGDDLAGVALLVHLAQTDHLAELLLVLDLWAQ